MAEYIKREDAINAVKMLYGGFGAIANINAIPSADVREIKRGRWSLDNIIFTDSDGVSRSGMRGYKCSECGGFCIGESNYCPNCGADMGDKVV